MLIVHDRVHSIAGKQGEQEPGQVAEGKLVILLGVRFNICGFVLERGPWESKDGVLAIQLRKRMTNVTTNYLG